MLVQIPSAVSRFGTQQSFHHSIHIPCHLYLFMTRLYSEHSAHACVVARDPAVISCIASHCETSSSLKKLTSKTRSGAVQLRLLALPLCSMEYAQWEETLMSVRRQAPRTRRRRRSTSMRRTRRSTRTIKTKQSTCEGESSLIPSWRTIGSEASETSL